MTRITGGCQCGAVRYAIIQELDDPHVCHCRMCQKAAGNYFMPLGGTHKNNFEITRGAPAWYHSSGEVRRGFCGNCGTPLFFESIGHHGISITLGSLDDPGAVRPVSSYGSEGQYDWIGDVCAMRGRTTEQEEFRDGERIKEVAASNRQHPDHDTEDWVIKR